MAFNELEERISKIRQQNEKIKRRYEEVEEDKKNAAKLNALVQMVPSTDWPERKEPPEYSNPPKVTHKQKSVTKEQSDQFQYHHSNDRRKGAGPPSDPKYNFLADSERDEDSSTNARDNSGNKNYNRSERRNFKKRGTGREGQQTVIILKGGRVYQGTLRDEHKPEYEAWRKERNRIDEDRISRQKTAEGNWRREWDNDKAYLANEIPKGEGKMNSGDFTKKDHKDGRHLDGNGYASHNRGAYHKSYRGSSRNYHGNHDYHHMNSYDQHNHDASSINSTSISADERTVIATDKSIKVTLNQSAISQGPVMSVKVNSPSIAGTGRVGPRQRTRVTYSSNSDVEANTYEGGSFSRQKSFEDKNKANHFTNSRKTTSRMPQSQKKKENDAKSPYLQKKEYKKENSAVHSTKHYENGSQQNFVRRDYKDTRKFHYSLKSPRALDKKMKTLGAISHDDDATNECSLKTDKTIVESDTMVKSQELNIESPNTEVKIDESSVVTEEQLKTDEESNEIILKDCESSPSNPETINEKDEELNGEDGDVSFTTNQDSVSNCENKNIDEQTKKDDPILISHMEVVDNNVESANNKKEEISDSHITVDNTIVDSYTSDNNKNILDTAAQVKEMKTELIKETVSIEKVGLVDKTESVEEIGLVQEIESLKQTESVQGTESVQESKSIQESESIRGTESIQESESIRGTESIQESESIRGTESIQESESIRGTESIQESESIRGTESIQESESIRGTESIQESESIRGTESIQESESIRGTESIQESESIRGTESIQETKLAQKIESVENEAIRETNLVKESESVPETKLIQEVESVSETKLVNESESVPETRSVEENKLVEETELIQNDTSLKDLNKSNEQNDAATKTYENRSEIVMPSEELASNTCVIVKEDETTCHDNKVPVEENILQVDNTNNKCAVKHSENSVPKCVDETSESSLVDKVENRDETVDKILEDTELQNKNVQAVVDEQLGGSVTVQANTENKEK